MKIEKWLNDLKRNLKGNNGSDDVLDMYKEQISDLKANGKSDEEIIKKIGDPKIIANDIKGVGKKVEVKSGMNWWRTILFSLFIHPWSAAISISFIWTSLIVVGLFPIWFIVASALGWNPATDLIEHIQVISLSIGRAPIVALVFAFTAIPFYLLSTLDMKDWNPKFVKLWNTWLSPIWWLNLLKEQRKVIMVAAIVTTITTLIWLIITLTGSGLSWAELFSEDGISI